MKITIQEQIPDGFNVKIEDLVIDNYDDLNKLIKNMFDIKCLQKIEEISKRTRDI